MTRERRAIDTTTASTSSFSLSFSLCLFLHRDRSVYFAVSFHAPISVVETRRTRDLSRRRAPFGELAEMHGDIKVAGRRRREGRDTFYVARNLQISRESRTDFASRVDIHGRLFPPPCYLFGSRGQVSYGYPRASRWSKGRKTRTRKARFAVYPPRKLARKVYV